MIQASKGVILNNLYHLVDSGCYIWFTICQTCLLQGVGWAAFHVYNTQYPSTVVKVPAPSQLTIKQRPH